MDTSNTVSVKNKLMFISISIALFSYGTYGVWNNDLPVFYSFKAQAFLRLHGFSAWMMYGAIISICLGMLSEINGNAKYISSLNKYIGESFLIFLILSLYSAIYTAATTNA